MASLAEAFQNELGISKRRLARTQNQDVDSGNLRSHTLSGNSTGFVNPAQNSTVLFTEDSQVLVCMFLQLSSLDFQ